MEKVMAESQSQEVRQKKIDEFRDTVFKELSTAFSPEDQGLILTHLYTMIHDRFKMNISARETEMNEAQNEYSAFQGADKIPDVLK
jgi:hypothetical protein